MGKKRREFRINPSARNPSYPNSACLAGVFPEISVVTIDLIGASVWATTFVSGWWEEWTPADNSRYATTELVAEGILGKVYLTDWGFHPYADRCWSDLFSVQANKEEVQKLHAWLLKEGYPEIADMLEDLFFDMFVPDTFWDSLLKQTWC